MAALVIVAAKTADNYRNDWLKGARVSSPSIPDPSVHLKAFGMTGSRTKRLGLAVLR